jgi:hypothetical protein
MHQLHLVHERLALRAQPPKKTKWRKLEGQIGISLVRNDAVRKWPQWGRFPNGSFFPEGS